MSAEVKGKIAELQDAIISAQQSTLSAHAEQFAMIERVRNLEEELTRVKAWEETKQRYSLIRTPGGTFVYARKQPAGEPSELPHWICTNCYENGRKSILQSRQSFQGGLHVEHHCAACKAIAYDHVSDVTAPRYSE